MVGNQGVKLELYLGVKIISGNPEGHGLVGGHRTVAQHETVAPVSPVLSLVKFRRSSQAIFCP